PRLVNILAIADSSEPFVPFVNVYAHYCNRLIKSGTKVQNIAEMVVPLQPFLIIFKLCAAK
ncbi:MAG: hypothetical protein IJ897_08645, partial [Prevotella sp.]|nr:hypothetical protein [Prevotella sp.]MBR6843391.1 hypothetical protein [Prevotella sp.]MBR6843395.1 hypothetical protein [Prevotella sp.]